MPKVGGKKNQYTPAGAAAAKREAQRTGVPMKKEEPKRKGK